MNSKLRSENDVTLLSVPQVILLCFLVTVVASVATAMTVVQLVASTPGETVFQTIEKITETVVEKPVQTEPGKTVVIKEGDLVAKAIANNSNSGQAVYIGDESTEVVLLGYGFVVANNVLVSKPYDVKTAQAGLHNIATRGSDKLMYWETTGAGTFSGLKPINIVTGNPQVGQTAVYLGADGAIVRGFIRTVSATGLEFSESLAGKGIGLIMDVSGDSVGLWTGSGILRAEAVETQISQLAVGSLWKKTIDNTEVGPDLSNPDTNPTDVSSQEKKESCELLGGTFNEYDECGGIDQANCLLLGGQFNECGSPCRHDDSAEICMSSCELYCQL